MYGCKITQFSRTSQKKLAEKVAGMKNNAYLCTVKQYLFGYPGRIPRGQDYTDTALGVRHHDNCSVLNEQKV